jgi:hypothetical protein
MVYGLTDRCSQPMAVLMTIFHITSTLRSAAKLAPASVVAELVLIRRYESDMPHWG